MKRLEFRDGFRDVPDHIAQHLEQIETYQFTYRQAMNRVNNRFLIDRLERAHDQARSEHLARFGRE